MDELCAKTSLALGRMNEVLCYLLLDGKTAPVSARRNGKKITLYSLKTKD